ncbi:MAG: hypothetical protein ACKOC9_01970, partial [Alphaproteobacteria bacterium]
MAISVDFPTPEAEKSPSLCPRLTGVNRSSTLTPSGSRTPSRERCPAAGAGAWVGRWIAPGAGMGPPSSGLPIGSSTRPSQASETGKAGRGASVARMPDVRPVSGPSAIACA